MDNLRTAESNAASADLDQANSSVDAAESQPTSNFVSSVVGGVGNLKGKGKGFFARKGPIALIISLVFGGGVLMFGSQALMPFSLLEQFRETFNSMNTATNLRTNKLLRYQLDPARIKDPVTHPIFSAAKFKISDSQAAKLSKQGIEYDANAKVLRYNDGSGNIRSITADQFDNFYKTNPDFFNKYNAASMTWRGAIANWFGTITNKFISCNRLTRNRFVDFQQKAAANGGNTKATAIDIMGKNADDIEAPGTKQAATDQKEGTEEHREDDEGNIITWFKCLIRGSGCNANRTGSDGGDDGGKNTHRNEDGTFEESTSRYSRSNIKSQADVEAILKNIETKYSGADKIVNGAQKITNGACMGLTVIGAINLMVSASETLQIINLITSYSEAIDKVKAGDGNDSPIHDLANGLTEKKKNTHIDINRNETATEKSAMESNGITALYSGAAIDYNDPSVASFNFSRNITPLLNNVLGSASLGMQAFETCAIAKMAANGTKAVVDTAKVVSCIGGVFGAAFTVGTTLSACVPLVAGVFSDFGRTVLAGIAVSTIISIVSPLVAQLLTRDLISNLGGEDLGNALTSGANIYLGNSHRANGGSLATYDKYIAYSVAHEQVVAENARYERQTKSPFDPSSQYTFLGSMLTKFMSFTGTSSVANLITTTSSVVSSSLISVLPTATAYDISSNLIPDDEYAELCPYLASIGATGDAYCNPYAITDISTMDEDPSEVVAILEEDGNFLSEHTEEGNVKINGNSDLAKYINFCNNRTSAFGVADQNIASAVGSWGTVNTESAAFNSVTNTIIGAVPIVGDFLDVITSAQQLANAPYISGEACVAGNTTSGSATDLDGSEVEGSPDWETAKYYQRFVEDQSLMESMGIIEKSAVTAYLDEYYEQNPLDNSYEGILARYSGLEKDDVVALLDIIDYGNYIANYNPAERYQFAPADNAEKTIYVENSDTTTLAILPRTIVFADTRNRFFVIS